MIASITECLGTKVLVADAVRAFSRRSHYDTIAQDTIAMAVNDLVTVGATPLSTHAYWSAGSSGWFADQERVRDLVRAAACSFQCADRRRGPAAQVGRVPHRRPGSGRGGARVPADVPVDRQRR